MCGNELILRVGMPTRILRKLSAAHVGEEKSTAPPSSKYIQNVPFLIVCFT
jgi:hypothetical protein